MLLSRLISPKYQLSHLFNCLFFASVTCRLEIILPYYIVLYLWLNLRRPYFLIVASSSNLQPTTFNVQSTNTSIMQPQLELRTPLL